MLNVILFFGDPSPPEVYRDLAWSPDGQYIAVGSDMGLFIFDSATLEHYRVSELYIVDVAWSGNDILVGLNGGTMLIFSGDQFSVQTSFTTQTLAYWEKGLGFNAVEWSPTQDVLATGLSNGNIQLFSFEVDDADHLSIQPSTILTGHTDRIRSLDWNSDGTTLFSISRDNTIRVWDVETGQLVYSIGDLDISLATEVIALSYNDSYFVHNQHENVYRRDATTGVEQIHISVDWNISNIALSSVDDRLAIVDEGEVNIWDTTTSRHLLSLGSGTSAGHIAWSPDGQRIAGIGFDDNQRLLTIWDITTGNIIKKYSEDD